MYPWNCCRTCLNVQSLHPIFAIPDHSDKYSNVIQVATGVKVEINDTLPQEMCSVCIAFINESVKFRKLCEEAQKSLLDNKVNNIKSEPKHILKTEYENATAIDISVYLPNDDDFKDYDDNITLDTFQYNNDIPENKTCEAEKPTEVEFETRVLDVVEQPIEIIFNSKKNKTSSVKMKPRKTAKTKLEKEVANEKGAVKEKTERVKEEIECEYCHKILTSRLSLRNHYKIHTGFDVVCEHCGKKFITRRLLLMHCRAKHGYEKTDKCSYCDYKASNAEQVKIHERLHTGERPYVCKECSAGFHRKSSYLQHIAIHLPEKTVQCGQCPARFKSVTLMRIHASRHRAPHYSFRCSVCDGKFARRRNVARHLQRVHALQPDPRHIERLSLA